MSWGSSLDHQEEDGRDLEEKKRREAEIKTVRKRKGEEGVNKV